MKQYGLDLIVTIANRSRIDAFLDIYRSHGLTFNVTANARGTASPEARKLLGLEDTEKAMLFAARQWMPLLLAAALLLIVVLLWALWRS